jgi:hypothetical protein
MAACAPVFSLVVKMAGCGLVGFERVWAMTRPFGEDGPEGHVA